MPRRLNREDRLRLLRFVCSFAWADLEVTSEERDFVARLVMALDLHPSEAAQAMQWLELPPSADDVDPQDVPLQHREMFLEAARQLIVRDGQVDPAEAENLALLDRLLT
jgi:hypothetical protein